MTAELFAQRINRGNLTMEFDPSWHLALVDIAQCAMELILNGGQT